MKFKTMFVLPLLLIAGCSLTPRQQYNLAAKSYDVTAIGLGLTELYKPFPPATWSKIQADEAIAVQRLSLASQWLKDNPALADTKGVEFPPLDPFNVVLDTLQSDLSGIVIVQPSQTPSGAAVLK